MVVLGIATSIIVVQLGGDDRREMQREAKRLAGALEHAAAVAQWSGETLGVSAEGRVYRFWRRDSNDQWSAFGGDEVLAERTLPTGFVVSPASYAGAPVAADAVLPLRASGRNEPYALALASPAGTIVVSSDPLNRVALAPLATSEATTLPTSSVTSSMGSNNASWGEARQRPQMKHGDKGPPASPGFKGDRPEPK
jgi:type II secretion system protein H